MHEDHLSRLGETQEADTLINLHLEVYNTGQILEKGHPIIRFGERGISYQGGMVVWTSP